MLTPTITPERSWPHTPKQPYAVRTFAPTWAGRLIAAASRWYRTRRDGRQLMAFDDRRLQDIGLSRGEIDSAVETGRDWL